MSPRRGGKFGGLSKRRFDFGTEVKSGFDPKAQRRETIRRAGVALILIDLEIVLTSGLEGVVRRRPAERQAVLACGEKFCGDSEDDGWPMTRVRSLQAVSGENIAPVGGLQNGAVSPVVVSRQTEL